MINVLCYGDSNTYGFNPVNQQRFERDIRWTGVLQDLLGDKYYVIEEGLGGRTTVWNDPIEEGRNGKTFLLPCLQSHMPLDLVVLMLGTNDTKKRFSLTSYDIAAGMDNLIKTIQKSECGRQNGAPEILLLAPPLIGKLSNYAEMMTGASEKSKMLAPYYEELAERYNIAFFDVESVVSVCDEDGVHLDAKSHRKLAEALAEIIAGMAL